MQQQLTQLQENFCKGLALEGLSQAAAYEAAGYSVDNKQPSTIYEAASRLAADSKIVARVAELRGALQEKAVVTAADILSELKGIGTANLADLVSWSDSSVTLKDSEDLPPELTALVAEVQETRHKDGASSVKIKLHDKIVALDKMAKILGLYHEQPPPTGNIKITKVTVVLNHGDVVHRGQGHDRAAIEGSRVLPDADDPE